MEGLQDISANLKAKELRKKTDKELMEMVSKIDRILMRYRAGQHSQTGGMINLPVGKKQGSVDWGTFGKLKRNKARIYTVLTESKGEVMSYITVEKALSRMNLGERPSGGKTGWKGNEERNISDFS